MSDGVNSHDSSILSLQRQCDINHETIKRLTARLDELASSVVGRHVSDPTPAREIEIQWWEACPGHLMVELWDPVLQGKSSFRRVGPGSLADPAYWRFHSGPGRLDVGHALSEELSGLVCAHPVLSLIASHYGIKP